METDHTKQLDALLSQSTKILNKNGNTEETDASTTSKRDKRSSSPFDNQDTPIEIIMDEKRYINVTISGQQLKMTGMNKSIIEPQKVAPVDLEALKIT